MFNKYAKNSSLGRPPSGQYKDKDSLLDPEAYITMDDFVSSCFSSEEEGRKEKRNDKNQLLSNRIANTYNILRKEAGIQRINFSDYCLFHLLMARPDPEVDIAFLLMDSERTGHVNLTDFKRYISSRENSLSGISHFDLDCDIVKRFFGKRGDKQLAIREFSEFLKELQREMGRQKFVKIAEDSDQVASEPFVELLSTACGWRLPQGVLNRLSTLYLCGDTDSSRKFRYGDFIALQEVLSQLKVRHCSLSACWHSPSLICCYPYCSYGNKTLCS
jgi:hypothetical protein